MVAVLSAVLGLCLSAFCAYSFISVWAAFKWKRSRPTVIEAWQPGVTILKPVRGIESPHTYDNFASFCNQDYPADKIQIIFGCQDPLDPVIEIVRRLQRDFPDRKIDLICSGSLPGAGSNLKVRNLIAMLPVAEFEHLVLCDSDMRVDREYIRRIVAPFRHQSTGEVATSNAKQVGLVTCPYRGALPQSLSAILEGLGIGADFIPGTLTSRALEGVGFAFGSTIVIPRTVLAQIGGFERILDELADDFRLGEAVRKAGYEVILSDYVVDDVLGAERLKPMWDRRLRWAKTVRSCRPGGYAGMFITYGIPLALLLFGLAGGSRLAGLALIGTTGVRLACAWIVATLCTQDRLVTRFLLLLPLSDIFSFALYVASYGSNRIVWRGDTFYLQKGGKMVRAEDH